jgi:hypothetical protein
MNKEYKGYFYGNDEEKDYYEGGAHFSYFELYSILEKLSKQTQARQRSAQNQKVINIIINCTFVV